MLIVKRRRLFAVLLVLAALGIATTAAAALTIQVPSRITIESHHGLHFMGEVHADTWEPCERQRRVLLFRVVKNGPDQVVGRDTTSNKGDWSIMPQGSAGISLARFYAKVKKASRGAAPVYACHADRSPTLKAGSS